MAPPTSLGSETRRVRKATTRRRRRRYLYTQGTWAAWCTPRNTSRTRWRWQPRRQVSPQLASVRSVRSFLQEKVQLSKRRVCSESQRALRAANGRGAARRPRREGGLKLAERRVEPHSNGNESFLRSFLPWSLKFAPQPPRSPAFTLVHVVVLSRHGYSYIKALDQGMSSAILAWHRALPNVSPHPRTIVYFQFCQTMMHPLHRPTPYEGDLSRYTAEERFLLHEPKSAPTGWVYGDAHDKVRMDRFRREGEGADYYQKALEAELAGAG